MNQRVKRKKTGNFRQSPLDIHSVSNTYPSTYDLSSRNLSNLVRVSMLEKSVKDIFWFDYMLQQLLSGALSVGGLFKKMPLVLNT